MSNTNYILHLDASGEGQALPLALEGLPAKNSEGEAIHYRRMKIAECGDWTHRGTGEPLEIASTRADEWIRNTSALSAAGHKPYITTIHVYDETGSSFREPDARETVGYVERVERDGNDIFAVVGLHGDESLKVAARNSRSVGVAKRDARDAKGNTFPGEYLHHLALCPNSALPNLGGTARIAASADRPACSVPVFTLAAATPQQESTMTKETAKKFRDTFKVAADVADDKLADIAAEKALALSADVQTLTTERDTAKADAKAKDAQVIALSASDKEPDAHTMIHVNRAMQASREAAVKSGVISEGGVKELDAIFFANGKPNKLALSLSANPKNGQQDWLYTRVLDVIASNPGVKTDDGIPRDVQARSEAQDAIVTGVSLSLSGDTSAANAKKRDRQAELLAEQLGVKKTA